MKVKKLIFITLAILTLLIALFIAMLFFSWRSDVSDKEPYIYFLNTPLKIERPCVITTRPVSNRFEKHNLTDLHPEHDKAETTKKTYNIGDTIQFHAAKSFYSMHVGTSYHLIGRDTLTSGKVIEFEYYLTNVSPRAWETLESFLARQKI